MSTERKPGSRGSMSRSSAGALKSDAGTAPNRPTAVEDDDAPKKGSTKTKSPRTGFKKRPRK